MKDAIKKIAERIEKTSNELRRKKPPKMRLSCLLFKFWDMIYLTRKK